MANHKERRQYSQAIILRSETKAEQFRITFDTQLEIALEVVLMWNK